MSFCRWGRVSLIRDVDERSRWWLSGDKDWDDGGDGRVMRFLDPTIDTGRVSGVEAVLVKGVMFEVNRLASIGAPSLERQQE